MALIKCNICGEQVSDKAKVCPHCGTELIEETTPDPLICEECGNEIPGGKDHCPKCGCPVYQEKEEDEMRDEFNEEIKRGNSKKKLIPIITGATIAVLFLVLLLILRGIPVSEVSLNKKSLTITEGKTMMLVCTVTPDNAKNKSLTWKSSNEAVARVDEVGTVTAVSEGTCKITVTSSNGKSDECDITVEKAGPDFKALYNKYCKSTWSSYGSDGSFLSIDTNPYDIDDTGIAYIEAYLAIRNINTALGLPSSLINDMGNTTALMGRQSETFSNVGVTVTWTYHPDKGLQVTYKAINK